jgi:hypothetical protein
MLRYREFVHKLNLEDVYDALGFEPLYQKENKKGETEDIGHCPDPWNQHKNGDTTGKLAINRERRVANCWVCGGSSLLSLTMAVLNLDPDEAVDFLRPFATERDQTDDEFRDQIHALLAQLDTKRSDEAMPYFNPRVLAKWDGPSSYEGVLAWNKGAFDDKPKLLDPLVIEQAGLIYNATAIKFAPRSKGDGLPIDDNYVGPCIIFPHYWKGKLVGWQHRWLESDRPKWVAKYTNTPDFPKNFTVYGVHEPSPLPVVIVESVPTALYVESLGWPSDAVFGASVTPEQMKVLRRHQQGVILAPDNDKPGIAAAVAIADYLEGFVPVSIIYPQGELGDDLQNIGQGFDEEEVRNMILNAERIS